MSQDCIEKKKAAAATELIRIDTGKKLSLDEAKAQLSDAKGPRYWRSLHELADTPEFRRLLDDEFPSHASVLDEVSRRDFMKVAAAGLALAGLSACTKQPAEAIIPFVRQPENMVLGKPAYFATAMPMPTGAIPLLARSNEGRPTKVEGNPNHPASMGGSDTFSQASVLGLYDPDRSQTIQQLGEVRPWGSFLGAVRSPLVAQKSLQGAGIRFLTETVVSPTMAAQMRDLLKLYPQAKWYQYDPVNRDAFRAGMMMAFGQPVNALYKIEAADVIVSLDADFLSAGYPGFLRYAREFASRRKVQNDGRGKSPRGMNRFYAIESSPTNTGGKADHRLPVRASEVENVARALASAVGASGAGGSAEGVDAKFIHAVAKDLQAHKGASLVIAGEGQPAAVHALAAAMNQALGNVGKTVIYTDPIEANPVDQVAGLKELVGEMWAGKVDMLVMVGGNPVYNAPADLDFAGAMNKVPLRMHLGLYFDETSRLCHWHVPMAHYLESWSDTRAYDGTISIVQPLIAPLYDGKSVHDFLTAFTDSPGTTGYDTLRNYWKAQHTGLDFETWWRKSLHDGFIADSALPEKQVTAKPDFGAAAKPVPRGQFEVIFRPDPNVWDGRFANNGFLQEMARPLTKLTWDNAVLMSPTTAKKLGLNTDSIASYAETAGTDSPPHVNEGDTELVTVKLAGREITAPAWVLPGHPDESITLPLGYGRSRVGRVGNGAGTDMYQLRTTAMPLFGGAAEVRGTGTRVQLAVTQHHQTMAGRELVRAGDLAEYERDPKSIHKGEEEPPKDLTLYPNYDYSQGYAWGMTIDVNSCIGCNACVVACYGENNIPVVGKEQVIKQREMHWIRIDTYYEGTAENPKTYFQPVPCMQCEDAPCEPVCPVGATVHSSEGLNDQVYNRCVGTRYCSNNCPYKVRRFNFFLFQDWNTPQLKMLRNPDVTVRSRGVMEKCTYCVQRINRGRIAAEEADRQVQDGDIQTACQQACPADAIVFGNINDKGARVTALKQEHRNYSLLGELNTRPRTTYLAAIRNPNPELETAGEKKGTHGA